MKKPYFGKKPLFDLILESPYHDGLLRVLPNEHNEITFYLGYPHQTKNGLGIKRYNAFDLAVYEQLKKKISLIDAKLKEYADENAIPYTQLQKTSRPTTQKDA